MTTNVDTTAARVAGEILAAVDSGDVDALCRRVTDDVRFQFGNAEVTTGVSAFEAASRAFFRSIAAIRHELLDLWEVEGGTVIAVMTVHYERLDGQKLSLPCCNLFGTRDGRVYDYRVYMDINPVFMAQRTWMPGIGVSRVAAAAINGHATRRLPELLLGPAVPAAIALYMLKFSKTYPDRVTHTEPAHAAAGHHGG